MEHRVLQLDPARLPIAEQGIEAYFLPVARSDILAIRDRLVSSAIASAQDAVSRHPDLAPLASSAFLSFIAEFLSVAEASLLFARTRAAGGTVSVPAGTDYWQPIASGGVPNIGRLDDTLGSRLVRPKRWKTPFRLLRNLFVDDGIARIPLSQVDLTQDIVATSVGGLITKAAQLTPKKVAYLPLVTWFDPAARPSPLSVESTRLIEAWIEDCRSAMATIGASLPDHLLGYLRDWLSRFLGIAQAHWRHLMDRPNLLPRQLWTGAGSRPLTRLMSHAVRGEGGEVTGYDHASGHGHIRSALKTLVDFWTCDTFVTFTDESRRALVETARRDLILDGRLPNFVTLPSQGRKPQDAGGGFPRGGPFPRGGHIMYVSGVYRLDRPVYMTRPFSLALLDWQARLLGRLGQFGYDVTLKAHPDSLFPPPDFFRKHAHIEQARFEQVAERADLFLFDNPLSTTFGHALKLSKPVVLIDFGLAEFTERGRELLERRCAIVPGRIDANNRWFVEWDALQEAIREAPERSDFEFVGTYLQAA
jgi:hypothetical protein